MTKRGYGTLVETRYCKYYQLRALDRTNMLIALEHFNTYTKAQTEIW
jgi:hypothetical protein